MTIDPSTGLTNRPNSAVADRSQPGRSRFSPRVPALAISGTDTDAGKTVLTLALAAYWQTHRATTGRLALLKPVQSGRGDREIYTDLFPDLNQRPEQFNPLLFAAPLAPPLAAEQEGRTVDLALAWQTFQSLCRDRDQVLVEGAGGLGTPIAQHVTVADLFHAWRLPTLLVVPVRLGMIGQAVAHVALARQTGVKLLGLVLNCTEPRSPEDMARLAAPDLIESLTQVPILGCLPFLGSGVHDRTALAEAAAGLALEAIGFAG